MSTTKEEKNFELRAYDKVELALLYCPGRSEETAMKTLTRWINGCGQLVQALRDTTKVWQWGWGMSVFVRRRPILSVFVG